MQTQIVNPNLHAILVHFPIAMLFAGTAIELFSFLWRQSSFRVAGRWMILIGAMAAIPAATTGMYAAKQAMGNDSIWIELKQHSNLSADQWENLRLHVKLNSIATGLLAVLMVVWLGASDRLRRRGHPIFLLALLSAISLIAAGAWRGGELVYANSTGVNLVKGGWPTDSNDKSSGLTTPADATAGDKKTQWAFDALDKGHTQLEKIDKSLDVHVFSAGWAVALALAALGLSFRALCAGEDHMENSSASDDDIVNALAGNTGEKRSLSKSSESSPQFESSTFINDPRTGIARFWLLAAMVLVGAILIGWMEAGPGSLSIAIDMLQKTVRDKFHIILGASILLLTLILALVTRFAPRNRVLVGCFALLLVTALAAQIWLGVLLTFDTSGGPINHFNTIVAP